MPTADRAISQHLYRVYACVQEEWMTSQQIADAAGVAPRTARAHASCWTKAGVFQAVAAFPGHRYRRAPAASVSAAWRKRIAEAKGIYG